MKKRKSKDIEKKVIEPIILRLDAIIRLLIEEIKRTHRKEFKKYTFIRILKSVGLTPTEIARILGKRSATDISFYLYSKKKKSVINGKIKS